MRDDRPYTYTIIRYVHDVVTGEFVNVGVVLHVPSLGLVDRKLRFSMGRLRGVFPDLDRQAFTHMMRAVERSIDRLAREARGDGLFASGSDAVAIAGRALPRDDSSLQWSAPAGAGLTNDPSRTLDRLFDRFVARYDHRSPHRRTDEDVWRPVRQKLDERHLSSLLQEKMITGGVDEIMFKHAWKNGLWHAYEPLSFDLADPDKIKTKAREWLGHLSAVNGDKTEPFKPHFIVGAPTRPELHAAYRAALAILLKAPFDPEIFEESRTDDLVDRLEDEARAHCIVAK